MIASSAVAVFVAGVLFYVRHIQATNNVEMETMRIHKTVVFVLYSVIIDMCNEKQFKNSEQPSEMLLIFG